MPTAERILPSAAAPSRFQAAMNMLPAEAVTLLGALLQPGKVLTEVEQMGKLLRAANAVDGRDPARARALRRRAAAIGMN